MPTRPRRTKRGSARRSPATELSVRMYDVGFGDCFLVVLPGKDRPRRMLIDCGSIKAGSAKLEDVVAGLVGDVTDADGVARIDVVVATHRHRDHVAGFAESVWTDVEVSEVWMPWTEDPADPVATRVRNAQSRLALALEARLAARLGATPPGPDRDRLADAHELALNALSNERAMRTLHHGFTGAVERRFLPEADAGLRGWTTPHLPGVAVRCLGPSRDLDVIRELDPPAGKSYLRLLDGATGSETSPPPFGPEWTLAPEDFGTSQPELAALISQTEFDELEKIAEGKDGLVAAALDKAVNGTSLMLVLEVGAATLFFPGDAQWGTWRKVLEDPTARQLLEKTNLYKVGHHGSHNATPIEFVEDVVGDGILAMVSTAAMKQWPRIPKQELLDALERRRASIARSDQPGDAPRPFDELRSGVIEVKVPI